MTAEELIRLMVDADLYRWVPKDRHTALKGFINTLQIKNYDHLVLRLFLQPDGEVPYYAWLDWPVEFGDGFMIINEMATVYAPDFEDDSSYLQTPEELENYPYFEIAIGG